MTHILDTDINKLREDQYKALKEHIISVLDDIRNKVLHNDFQGIYNNFIEYSPSGDDMGLDNHFINFSWNDTDVLDIDDVLCKLKDLSEG